MYIVRACLPHEQSPAKGCGKHRPPCTDRSPLHGMEAREQVEEQYRQCTMDESMSTDHLPDQQRGLQPNQSSR